MGGAVASPPLRLGRFRQLSRGWHSLSSAPPPSYNCPFYSLRSPTIATTVAPPSWTTKDAEKLYNMSGWGLGYFRVNAEGHVTVHPDANRKRGLDLYNLAMDLHAQGVGLPLLLRFSDILRSRIQALATEFGSLDAMTRNVTDKLQAARTAIARSQVDASGNILGALRTEVAALSGKGFTSEAVALVDVNVQYVLRLLAKR